MAREQIQIADLEPSYDGSVARYAIQIRGIDAEGRPGPWSEVLLFESPEAIGVIESKNYVPGESGWQIDDDGDAEFNDGNFRGDITGASGTFSGLLSGGTIRIGSGDEVFRVNSGGDMWVGSDSFFSAPFTVSRTGNMTANQGTFSGSLSSASGSFTGTVSGGSIQGGSIVIGATSSSFRVNSSGDMWLGGTNFNTASFRVTSSGSMTAVNGNFSGDISGGTIAIGSGNNVFRVNSSGDMWLGNANFASAPFRVTREGQVTATSGTFSGAIAGSTIVIGSGNSSFRVDANGNMWLGNADFASAPFRVTNNGAVTATNITITSTGNVSGGAISSVISDTHIPNLSANKITTGTLNANNVSITNLNANNITGGFLSVDRLQVNTINGNRILSNSITNDRIASISANKITAGTISSNVTMSGSVVVSGTLSTTTATFFPNQGNWLSAKSQLQLGDGSIGFGADAFSAVFPMIDRSGTNIRIRASGRLDMKANGGFRLEDGGIIGNTQDATGFGTVSAFNFLGTGSNRTGTLRLNVTTKTGVSPNVFIASAATPAGEQWFWWRSTSSRKYKSNITVEQKLNGILDVDTVIFQDRDEYEKIGESAPYYYGLIAEDLHDAGLRHLVSYIDDEVPESVNYDKIGVALIPYVKELYDRIEKLEEMINGS